MAGTVRSSKPQPCARGRRTWFVIGWSAFDHVRFGQIPSAYIDRILRDMDEVGIKENGSTELGQYISLKLGVG
jgi:hypothetical protein